MQSIIAVIKQSDFVETNFDEILRPHFKEFTHKNTKYMRISTFEKYGMSNTFEQVFYSEAEFEAWLVEVPLSITKLQAISLLLKQGKYNDLMIAIESDPSGAKKILFDAAHQLDRNSTMVNEIALALEMNEDDKDAFFIEADKILI